ncbi:MAG: hypothetical protein Q9195_006228 [Heterodermia aff. obscurata]
MRLIALAPLAVAVSQAGGLGFIAAGSDLTDLTNQMKHAKALLFENHIKSEVLPIGVGFINWGIDLQLALDILANNIPAAVWFFAPERNQDLVRWTSGVRNVTQGKTKIWIQIGTVAEAVEVANLCNPDVLVVQGADAGGHGLERGAGIITLLPEVADAMQAMGKSNINLVAAGGIAEGRGVAACLALGAEAVVMGTRFLASEEANIAKGYQDDVLNSSDGGVRTVRSKVYDTLRGTTGWPDRYGGRGIINESYMDAVNGEVTDEMKRLYEEALMKGDEGWGEHGRLTAYAGTVVGLVHRVLPARDIVSEVRSQALQTLSRPHTSML